MLEQSDKCSMNEVFLKNYFTFIDSMDYEVLEQVSNENNDEFLKNKETFFKTILKTKYLIPTYTEKKSSDTFFQADLDVDFISLKNKESQLILPIFTTKSEIKQVDENVNYMIINFFEANYLATENNLQLVINPFSINYFVDYEVEQCRQILEGVLSPTIEILVKIYRKTGLNQYYMKILELLKTEELYMPLCLDDAQDYTLSYKEKDNKVYLCLYVSQRSMYKKIPDFQSYETVNLRNILKVIEMMNFEGILIQGDILIDKNPLEKL